MRLLQLFNAEARLHIQGSLWHAAGIMAFWLLIHLNSPYFFILYLGGALLAANSFNDIHDPTQAYRSLTLPCSNLEKWLTKWFISTFGFAFALLLLFYFTVVVQALIPFHFIGYNLPYALPTLKHFGETMLVFLPLNALGLAGAAYFRRYVLLKTGLIASIVLVVVTRLAFYFGTPLLDPLSHLSIWKQDYSSTILYGIAITVWLCIVMSLYSLSFYFYKNTEING